MAVLLYYPHRALRPAVSVLRLAGLDADAVYEEYGGPGSTAEPPGAGPRTTGRVLMSAGLPVRDRLPAGDWASALVRLRRVP